MLDNQLRIFLTVCEKGTMTKAAESLYLTQPAVSQAITALEHHYQTKLFDRIGRGLQLTASGRALKASAQDIIRRIDEIDEVVLQADNDSDVRIGVNLSVGKVLIHDYLRLFREIHPSSGVSVKAVKGFDLRSMLDLGELDFLLMEEPQESDDYILEPFFQDRIVMVVRPDDDLLKKRTWKLSDLRDEPFFLREKGAGVREQFDHLCQAHGISIKAAWESSSTSILVNALLQGERGIAVLPYLLIRDELDTGALKELHVSDASLGRTLYIVHHRSKHLSRTAKDFIKIVKESKHL